MGRKVCFKQNYVTLMQVLATRVLLGLDDGVGGDEREGVEGGNGS